MKKHYALTRTDGGVSIMEIVPHAVRINGVVVPARYKAGTLSVLTENGEWGSVPADAELIYATVSECLAKWTPARRGEIVSVREIALADCPTDRVFRNAWKDGGSKIEIDMQKAREIKRDDLRQLRAPLLADLDVAYMRADEVGDAIEKQRIAAKKQALRDVTADPMIDAATTPEQLKAVWPEFLK